MWETASTTEILTTTYAQIGEILLLAIPTLTIGLIALMGLGFGIQKLEHHILMNKSRGTRAQFRKIMHR